MSKTLTERTKRLALILTLLVTSACATDRPRERILFEFDDVVWEFETEAELRSFKEERLGEAIDTVEEVVAWDAIKARPAYRPDCPNCNPLARDVRANCAFRDDACRFDPCRVPAAIRFERQRFDVECL